MAKANYEKPASLVDLEERQKKDYVPMGVLVPGTDREQSDNGYVNVDPIYQTFANETEKPFAAESGAEAKVEKNYFSDDVDFDAAATVKGESEEDEPEEEEEETPPPAPSPTPGSPS